MPARNKSEPIIYPWTVTELRVASSCTRLLANDVAVLLLGAGADPNLTDSDGDSALHTAAGACLPARQQVSDTS